MAAKVCVLHGGGGRGERGERGREGGRGGEREEDLTGTHTDGATEHKHWECDSSKKYDTKDDKQFFEFGKSIIRDPQIHTASTGEAK